MKCPIGSWQRRCQLHPFPCQLPAVGKPCQLEVQVNQYCGKLPQLAVGNDANLPTGANPRGCWTFSHSPVGENSPSYYVGEGTDGPSTLRGGLPRGIRIIGHPCPDPGIGSRHPDRLGTARPRWRSDQWIGILQAAALRGWRHALPAIQTLAHRDQTVLRTASTPCTSRRCAATPGSMRYTPTAASWPTLTAWCEHHQIPYQGVPVGTIKKHATGKGNANKDQMISAARLRGHAPADDNEADAIALFHWAVETQGCEMKVPTPRLPLCLARLQPIRAPIREAADQARRMARPADPGDLARRHATRLGRTRTAAPDRRSAVRVEGASTWLSGRSKPWPTGSSRPHELPTAFLRFACRATFNCWPAIKRMPWENLGAEPPVYRFPPDPAAIDRMLETMRWVQWLRRNSDTSSGCGTAVPVEDICCASPVTGPLPGVVGRQHWRSWSSSCKGRRDVER